MKQVPTDVQDYINQFEVEIQVRLLMIRSKVFEIQPDCTEKISYGVIAFKNNNGYFYISAFKNHIGMYPFNEKTELGIELKPYFGKGTKASLHFLHNKDLPLDLIRKLIMERLSK
jgi:uncharacterized protein YdhG (YjbR/CyaY superfamily)